MTDPPPFEILSPPPKGVIRHALFDFDGTISLLREGWQQVMGPMMLDMICGESEPTPEIEQRVAEFIDETTGIQTIVQMEGLAQLVREYGLVPDDEILDPAGYKAIYNDRLMERVNVRRKEVESGALSIEDATVRGVRAFIQALAEQGVTLYIFSGTDREDVEHEARLLGVAEFFAEITGAIGNYAAYNKERVIKELVAEHQLSGPEVLVIGDGPVEIRHGAALGCATVGVASDELNRRGWDEAKRARLAKAGAHILVPEFSQPEPLFETLAFNR